MHTIRGLTVLTYYAQVTQSTTFWYDTCENDKFKSFELVTPKSFALSAKVTVKRVTFKFFKIVTLLKQGLDLKPATF